MNRLEISSVIIGSFFFLIFASWEVYGLKCYVCKDCDLYLNDTLVNECEENQVRCVKREMINKEVERSCGTVDDCKVGGGGGDKNSKTGSSSNSNRNRPRRIVRQLLQSQPKVDENANIVTEFTSLNCCEEDECNGAFSFKFSPTTTISTFLISFLVGFYTLFYHFY